MIKTHDAGKTVTINDSERRKFRVLGQGETGGAFNRMRGQYCVRMLMDKYRGRSYF